MSARASAIVAVVAGLVLVASSAALRVSGMAGGSAFGLVAFLMTGLNPHFVPFMATGVLVLIPALGPGAP